MILISLSVLHQGSSIGKIIGTPKNLDIAVCENGSSSSLPPSKPPQQPPAATPKPPLNQNQPSSYPTFGGHRGGKSSSSSSGSMMAQPSVKQEQKTPTKQFYGAQANAKPYGRSPSSLPSVGGSPITTRNVFPIASLNPYQNKLDLFHQPLVSCNMYIFDIDTDGPLKQESLTSLI